MNRPADPVSTPTLTLLRVIWLGLAVAPVSYLSVAFLTRPGSPLTVSLPDPWNPLELVLTIASLVAIAAGFVVPRLSGSGVRRQLGDLPPVDDDERARAVQPVLISRWAMFESVAIYGFVIVLAGSPPSRAVPFAAVAMALLLAHPPSRAHVDALLGE